MPDRAAFSLVPEVVYAKDLVDRRVIVDGYKVPNARSQMGNVSIMVQLSDGDIMDLHTYFSDEQLFDVDTFIGHTLSWSKAQVSSTHRAGWGLFTEVANDAGYDHSVYAAWRDAKYPDAKEEEPCDCGDCGSCGWGEEF